MSNKFFVFLCLVVFFISCKKIDNFNATEETPTSNDNQIIKQEFAKGLAAALLSEESLRVFLKNEALKKFDNDYDILYVNIKDEKINGITVNQVLSKYFSSEKELDSLVNQDQLITIFIPELKNFSAKLWNTETEIPNTAVDGISDENGQKVVRFFNDKGDYEDVSLELIPDFPVVIIKDNERVKIKRSNINTSNAGSRVNSNSSYEFIDNAFNGLEKKPITGNALGQRIISYNSVTGEGNVDKKVIDAYVNQLEWQRDYIYYSLNPPIVTQGQLDTRFHEFINTFKFATGSDYYKISDQTGDPSIVTEWSSGWTEGVFEFRVSINFITRNGEAQTLDKYFNAAGQDLFNIQYSVTQKRKWIGGALQNFYTISSITPKEFLLNIDIVGWDFYQYGSAWKFVVSEIDPSQTIVQTVNFSSEFGTNFTVGGAIEKVNVNFGVTSKFTISKSLSITTNLASDALGEAILEFRNPVITWYDPIFIDEEWGWAGAYQVSTGTISMEVSPKRIF